MTEPLVSIVIPVLRDSVKLERLLSVLDKQHRDSGFESAQYEVIVSNGDETDLSVQALKRKFSDVKWISSAPNRGLQMNVGAQQALGKWLLFLHADTYPSDGWFDEFKLINRDSKKVWGSLTFQMASLDWRARVVEFGVSWRVRWFGLPYGDQGLFVRRTIFEKIGGFLPVALMEDVELARRLQKEAAVLIMDSTIQVSARRWEHDGWICRTTANLFLLLFYFLGVSPDRLARYYYSSHKQSDPIGNKESQERGRDVASNEKTKIAVIIPALDEEEGIGRVLSEIPAVIDTVIVVDNGSSDATESVARSLGAKVISEPRKGYGRACAAGLQEIDDADIIVFLDGDCSDYPGDMEELLDPILKGTADFVMGARGGEKRPLVASLGTRLCVSAINFLWRTRFSDLGPFRAIRRQSLDLIDLSSTTYGWTIEMQVKAVEEKLAILEVPIRQRPRIGKSKISGTVLGTVRAGTRMLFTIWFLWFTRFGRRKNV
mgnify:CR=1 FL=1|tara:strand:+ start:2783 stop:4249 length:1467 start_codon:yes stop_codon:yes gene_type:complete